MVQFASYVESNDSALCHVCMLAAKQKKVSGMCSDQAFVTRGGKMLQWLSTEVMLVNIVEYH